MKKVVAFKQSLLFVCLIVAALPGAAQPDVVNEINRIETPAVALAPLRFLASDELMGRATLRPEINIAARYISEIFRSLQLKELPNTSDYFQKFDIKMVSPAKSGSLSIGDQAYQLGDDIFLLKGEDVNISAPTAYVGFGSKEDFNKSDVKGKIVIADFGLEKNGTFRKGYSATQDKIRLAREKGALALIQRVADKSVPWGYFKQSSSKERVSTDDQFPSLLLNDGAENLPPLLKNKSLTATLTIDGIQTRSVPARNVLACVEGTDPKLKDQYIILSAHYDHLGVADKPKMEEGKSDSIYNGARDNAVGVTAVIAAARFFAQHPPKRSVIFIAYTGEEIGLIGSSYFAAHPVVPFNKVVYNLNIDNASYNDTSIVSVVGLGRTSADNSIISASAAFGLKAMPDPVPEQNLFDRSDNVVLAAKGIPSPTFSLGFTSFDATIMKRYHQMSDEVGNFDLDYAMKYIKAFVLSSKYIADDPVQPSWTKGDKYESAWKELYQK